MIERLLAVHPALVDEDGVVLQRQLHALGGMGGAGQREQRQGDGEEGEGRIIYNFCRHSGAPTQASDG